MGPLSPPDKHKELFEPLETSCLCAEALRNVSARWGWLCSGFTLPESCTRRPLSRRADSEVTQDGLAVAQEPRIPKVTVRDWERASPETDGWEHLCGVAATVFPTAICNRPAVKIGNCDAFGKRKFPHLKAASFISPGTSFQASLSSHLAAVAVFFLFFFFPPCAAIDFSGWHRPHILDSAVR